MKIEFEIDKKYKTIDLQSVNLIYGGNLSGKTKLIEILNAGLTGKTKEFFLTEGTIVNKSEYAVHYINTYNLSDEIKLKTKSSVLKLLNNEFFDDHLEDLTDKISKINEFLFECEGELNNSELNISNELTLANYNYRLNIADVKDLITLALTMDFESQSSAILQEFIIKLLVKNIDRGKKNIFLIDDFDSFYSDKLVKKMLDFFKSSECIFVLTSNKYSSFKYTDDILVMDTELKVFDLDKLLTQSIMEFEYHKEKSNISFELFYEENKNILCDDDLIFYKKKIKPYIDLIGNVYVNKYSMEEITDIYKIDDKFLQILLNNLFGKKE